MTADDYEQARLTIAVWQADGLPEPVPNDARQEFMFDVLEGLPAARQKRLILRARDESVAFLTDAEAQVLIDALELRAT